MAESDEQGRLAASVRAIERAAGALATASVARMDEVLPWFRGLPADQRAWVMLVAQAGVRSFVEWLREAGERPGGPQELSDEIFDAAPRDAGPVDQPAADGAADQGDHRRGRGAGAAPGRARRGARRWRDAVLRFSREVAFGAARVYARAAESRGTWDARLQALLVDALLRGDSAGRAGQPGRRARLGRRARRSRSRSAARPAARPPRCCTRCTGWPGASASRCSAACTATGWWWCSAAPTDPLAATEKLLAGFGDGPGGGRPGACRALDEATESARAALAGFRAAPAWPTAPRPVAAADLLPERALAGDAEARRILRQEVYGSLARAGGELLETLDALLRRRRRAGERGPGAVRAPEHGALPAAACGRGHRPLAPAAARRVRPADRADGGPAGPVGAAGVPLTSRPQTRRADFDHDRKRTDGDHESHIICRNPTTIVGGFGRSATAK